jgi:hypothetical protein
VILSQLPMPVGAERGFHDGDHGRTMMDEYLLAHFGETGASWLAAADGVDDNRAARQANDDQSDCDVAAYASFVPPSW